MQIEAARKLFTVDDYYRMAEAGIIGPEDRVELIDGEIIQMSPIGHRHMVAVNRATDLFTGSLRGKAIVSVQNPLRLSNFTEPQPDFVLLKYRPDFYKEKRFDPADAVLVLEVADTTLRYDRKTKLPRYAAAGVCEYWIENLENDELLVYRDPDGNDYTTALVLKRGDFVSLSAFPETRFAVADLLG